jgi:hypothetical protein
MNTREARRLMRNFVIELIVYGTLVIVYALISLATIAAFMPALFTRLEAEVGE